MLLSAKATYSTALDSEIQNQNWKMSIINQQSVICTAAEQTQTECDCELDFKPSAVKCSYTHMTYHSHVMAQSLSTIIVVITFHNLTLKLTCDLHVTWPPPVNFSFLDLRDLFRGIMITKEKDGTSCGSVVVLRVLVAKLALSSEPKSPLKPVSCYTPEQPMMHITNLNIARSQLPVRANKPLLTATFDTWISIW